MEAHAGQVAGLNIKGHQNPGHWTHRSDSRRSGSVGRACIQVQRSHEKYQQRLSRLRRTSWARTHRRRTESHWQVQFLQATYLMDCA